MRNNLNPDFSTFIECDYYFEKEQFIQILLYDIDKNGRDYIGKTETTLANIFGA